MTTNANVIAAIAKGEERVFTLTHTRALGKPTDIKNALMALVAEGILEAYDDGRKVRLV